MDNKHSRGEDEDKKKKKYNIYCGNNRKSKLLKNMRIGSRYTCFKKGLGTGLNLPLDPDFGDYSPIDKRKVWCGEKNKLPVGYQIMGSNPMCLQKGVGIGKYLKNKKESEKKEKSKRKSESSFGFDSGKEKSEVKLGVFSNFDNYPLEKVEENIFKRTISGGKINMVYWVLNKGAKYNLHASSEKILYIIQGKIKMKKSFSEFEVDKGDVMVVPKKCKCSLESIVDTIIIDVY